MLQLLQAWNLLPNLWTNCKREPFAAREWPLAVVPGNMTSDMTATVDIDLADVFRPHNM